MGLVVIERDGELTLPAWYDAVQRLLRGGEAWLEFAYEMHNSRFEDPKWVEEVIAGNMSNEGGGWRGITADLIRAFKPLSDPLLRAAVSPPFTFSFEELQSRDEQFFVDFIAPVEFLKSWAMPLRLMFISAMIYKSRAPQAPRQLWIVDEAARLKAEDLIEEWYSFYAGFNIRPWTIWQSVAQMKPELRQKILASSSVRQFFGVRDADTAKLVSELCGYQTLSHGDELQKLQAAEKKHAALQAAFSGRSFVETALELRGSAAQAAYRAETRRALRTLDEVLNTPPEAQYIFCDHVQKLVYAERKPYYQQSWLAGKFLPNPLHPPTDAVHVKNRFFGYRTCRVLEAEAPPQFKHLRQYQSRPLRYIEGFEPWEKTGSFRAVRLFMRAIRGCMTASFAVITRFFKK